MARVQINLAALNPPKRRPAHDIITKLNAGADLASDSGRAAYLEKALRMIETLTASSCSLTGTEVHSIAQAVIDRVSSKL